MSTKYPTNFNNPSLVLTGSQLTSWNVSMFEEVDQTDDLNNGNG